MSMVEVALHWYGCTLRRYPEIERCVEGLLAEHPLITIAPSNADAGKPGPSAK